MHAGRAEHCEQQIGRQDNESRCAANQHTRESFTHGLWERRFSTPSPAGKADRRQTEHASLHPPTGAGRLALGVEQLPVGVGRFT